MKPRSLLCLFAACATSPEAVPAKVFDFAPRSLAGPATPIPAAGATPKAQLRALIDAARPALAPCIAHPGLDLAFTLYLDTDGVDVESVDADNACARRVLFALDTSWVPRPKTPERWTAHAALYTGDR